MYTVELLKSLASGAVSAALRGEAVDQELFEYPEDPANGDLAFPCFSLAKAAKKSPAAIATALAGKLKLPELFAKAEAKGPYLNFFVDREKFLTKVTEEVLSAGEKCGGRPTSPHEKVMVEYVSPNNNKPLHLGHVRNGVIGECVSSLLENCGHTVVRAVLLNDRGLAIAKAMLAYMKWGGGKTPESSGAKSDRFVADFYVMYEKKAKTDESLEAEAHELIRKWEAGDAAVREIWQTMSDWAENGQHETYKKLGFSFEVDYKESEIYLQGKEIVEEGLARGVFRKDSDGSVVAPLEAYGLPDKVVMRADGTSLYITQDLYLAKRKFEEQGLDRSIYVVGNEQNLHFRQLFKILELLGYPWASKLAHLSYGYVTLPEGRMKSREGTVVDADDLIASLEADAALEIKQRHQAIADDELVHRAHQVAMAAIKFHFLEVDVASDMQYDPKASLSFTGRTGPYVQYMHARVRSILRKSKEEAGSAEGAGRHPVEDEHRLAMLIARYPEIVRQASDTLRPSVVANYLYELSRAFASFYEQASVLNATPEDRAVRLKLAESVGIALKAGLALLGIEAPEEM